jgi:hypothetical protein
VAFNGDATRASRGYGRGRRPQLPPGRRPQLWPGRTPPPRQGVVPAQAVMEDDRE